LAALERIFDYLEANDIRMYRFASGLAPYASHPELPQFHDQVSRCSEELARLGELARTRDLRLSSHPGQYTVLNSEDPVVRSSAVAEIEVQAAIMDAMGLGAEAVVVLHVGGLAGGVTTAGDRFLAGFEQLSDAGRARLVLENDDRSFGLADVLALSGRTGTRVVWDVLHHHCHDPAGIPEGEALRLASATWPATCTPKIHYSSPRLDVGERRVRQGRHVARQLVLPQLRAHADLVDPLGFERFIRDVGGGQDFDVMLEAKAKDLALLRLRAQLETRGLRSEAGRLHVSAHDRPPRRRGLVEAP